MGCSSMKACPFEWKQPQSLVGRGAQLCGLGSHGLLFRPLALLYDLKVPRWDFQTGRQLRTSPLYDRLDAQGARWMEKHGFERPKYFVPPDKGKKARSHICSFCPKNNKSWFGLVLNYGFWLCRVSVAERGLPQLWPAGPLSGCGAPGRSPAVARGARSPAVGHQAALRLWRAGSLQGAGPRARGLRELCAQV